ncbi:potassium channel family protein [Haloferula sargassicola]|uniref:Ktr system potassium uptake protein A n=1 Tax=Haloferula sargassicola TaxID=490096 RepID=A0ABP9UP25_9BACT
MRIAIIGLGTFGRSLVRELTRMDHEILAMDLREEMVEKVKDDATFAVVADASMKEVVDELSLQSMDLIVVAIGKGFENSMMVTARMKQVKGPKLFVRSISDLHYDLLEMTGVDEVIRVESLAASNFAHRLDHLEFIRHILIDDVHAVAEIRVPEEFVGRTLREVALRAKHKLNLITVLSRGSNPDKEGRRALESIPTPDHEFKRGDVLVLYGHERDLSEFSATYAPQEA